LLPAGAIWPGGACTHWKAPPCHGAHVKQPLRIATVDAAIGRIPALAMGAQERQDKTF
jgi:hypothetical protein